MRLWVGRRLLAIGSVLSQSDDVWSSLWSLVRHGQLGVAGQNCINGLNWWVQAAQQKQQAERAAVANGRGGKGRKSVIDA